MADGRPLVMGVLNVTPDSFSDGGEHLSVATAVARAERMLEEGADVIDVGGESTRPGADAVTVDEELARVMPVVEALAPRCVVSIDTSKAEVMRAATAAGAQMINDVHALRRPGALAAAADSDAQLCLMHMQGQPRGMQDAPSYDDVVAEVGDFLTERLQRCMEQGIAPTRLWVDPGFGFGKTLAHNLALMRGIPALCARLQRPMLIGVSRKSMLGTLLEQPDPKQRVDGGLAAATAGVLWGARMVRTHDVGPTRDALRVATALLGGDAEANPS